MPYFGKSVRSTPFLVRFAKAMTSLSQVLTLVVSFGMACAIYFSRAAAEIEKPAKPALARLSADITVRAQGESHPKINLSDGRDVITEYSGSAGLIRALQSNQA